ncbi:MAG: MFS transporter [Longimicrobiales bacterium]|nr:MFS transporter [Longimicrobiales bacterium]
MTIPVVEAPPAPPQSRPARLSVLFLTVFIDLVGFGIVLPLLPLYADGFGASGTAVGLLVMSYSVAQFFMAPFWGRLSDRYGRRPILIVGLVGSGVAYLVFAWSTSLAWLFASRILAGIGGSTVPVAEAYIADVTPPERRAGNMGLIGAAFGLGFIVGPAAGGILAGVSFQMPGYVAAGLCFLNAVLALILLRESLPAEGRARARPAPFRFTGTGLTRALRTPALRHVLALYFLFTVAFAVIQPTLSLFGQARFALDSRQVGYLFAFLGLISAIVQGALVRLAAPRTGEAWLVRFAGIPFVAGLILMALAPSIPVLLAAIALLALGYGAALPAILGIVSRVAPPALQGGVLGVGQSVGSLARIAGPALAGAAFDVGLAVPYLLGASVAALATILAAGLPSGMPGGPTADGPRPASAGGAL